MRFHQAWAFALILTLGAGFCWAQMAVVNGASFSPMTPLAPGSFASMFGQNLCAQTVAGEWIAPEQLPTTLGGCFVTVGGSPAMLHYVSPGQINFIVPVNLGSGMMTVTVKNGSQQTNGEITIGAAGPGVFAMNGMGMGEGAMLHGTLWRQGPFSTTTDGQPTAVSIFLTGLDLSTEPVVTVGGVPVEVTFFGSAPGYAGLQQINIVLPPSLVGVGRVPVTATSAGQVSNVVFMTVLPTNAMMQGMPGWGPGMMVRENMPRGREMSSLAFNPANNTALVADEDDDVVRVISLDSKSTVATITLPQGSRAHAVAVNSNGSLAAVTLSTKASVALIDTAKNVVVAVIGTGNYPSGLTFSGSSLLVTNGASGTVSVIDVDTRSITRTVNVGFGPSGIAAANALGVVANLQGGSLSLIDLADFAVTDVPLPPGSRPHRVAISPVVNKAVVTTPMSNSFLVVDLTTKAVTQVETGFWNGMGPGAVAVNGGVAYIANQMTASVTVADLSAAKVLRTIPVDPGPQSLAVGPVKNQLLVLAEGTGTIDVVDLGSDAIILRVNAGDTERNGTWTLPWITSISPASAAAGSKFTLTISGTDLQSVKDVEFHFMGTPGGMMGGGMMGGGEDPNIKASNVQVNAAGTEVTATIEILASAAAGTRQVRLETDRGEIMAPMLRAVFTVTK